jgi:hypothetical protein
MKVCYTYSLLTVGRPHLVGYPRLLVKYRSIQISSSPEPMDSPHQRRICLELVIRISRNITSLATIKQANHTYPKCYGSKILQTESAINGEKIPWVKLPCCNQPYLFSNLSLSESSNARKKKWSSCSFT